VLPGDPTVRFTEPDPHAVKEMLLTLRQFDAPKDDIRLKRLFEVVERVGVRPAWRGRFDALKRAHAVRDDPPEVEIARPRNSATSPVIIGRRSTTRTGRRTPAARVVSGGRSRVKAAVAALGAIAALITILAWIGFRPA
jgi:hypothetical protein